MPWTLETDEKKRLSPISVVSVTLQRSSYDIVGTGDKIPLVDTNNLRVYELKFQVTLETYIHPYNQDLVFQKAVPLINTSFGDFAKSLPSAQVRTNAILDWF
jgi:hypothetical protein